MDIEPFALERFFARVEHDADLMLGESGVRSLPASDFDTDPGDLGYVVPTNGDPAVRATLAERYDRKREEVLCTCGTQEANFVAIAALMGTHAVCVTPTYQSLHALPAAFGEVTTVSLDPPAWDLDLEDVKAAMRPDTAVLVLDAPNNPTGRSHPRETVEALYEIAADNGTYLLCDEVYRLLDPDPLPPVASMGEYGISTSSVSKSYGLAGCRFGWLAGPAEVVEAAWNWKDYTTISPSPFGQHVARQAIDRRSEILADNRRLAADHRERVATFLDDHGLTWYEPTGVVGFPTVPDGFATGRSFCESVVRATSVVLAPGDAFGVPDRFRIGFGLPTDDLAEALSRLDDFLDRHA